MTPDKVSALDQLQPLIAPPAISWWPPAPGWWVLALLLPFVCWGVWKLGQRLGHATQKRRDKAVAQTTDPLRLAALATLASLPKPYDGQHAGLWLQQLNALLKRLSRAHYPNDNSHVLSGRAWLAFLDSRCPAAGLTRWMILVEGAYRAECRMSNEAIDGLSQAVNIWIRKHV